MKYRDIARKLKVLGCREMPRKGVSSHRKWYNPMTEAIVTIPDWGAKDLKFGTLRHAIQQLGIEWDNFNKA